MVPHREVLVFCFYISTFFSVPPFRPASMARWLASQTLWLASQTLWLAFRPPSEPPRPWWDSGWPPDPLSGFQDPPVGLPDPPLGLPDPLAGFPDPLASLKEPLVAFQTLWQTYRPSVWPPRPSGRTLAGLLILWIASRPGFLGCTKRPVSCHMAP